MSVVSMVVGATTPDGATFVAKVDGGGPVRVAVSTTESMTNPVFTPSQAVDAQGVAKVSITGLAPSTRHWWQVEDNGALDTTITGQFITHPPVGAPGSFTIALASCAGGSASVPGSGTELAPLRVSNHPVFGTIRSRGVAEGWLGFEHLGDAAYYDPGSGVFVPDASVSTYRRMWDDILAQSNQAAMMRDLAFGYIWDDHDYGPNNSDGTHTGKANAAQVVRERLPLDLAEPSGPIYRSWQIGRVLFIAWDVRYDRSPNSDPDGPSKTMLGSAQKAWMQSLLNSPPAGTEFLVVLSGSQWLWPSAGSGVDTWANFATERDEIAQMFADTGWANRMCMVYGDRHAVGIESGANNHWGGFPVLVAASLDSDTGAPITGLYNVLDDTPGRNQYGTLTVTDLGTVISVELAAWRGTTKLGSYKFGVSISAPPLGAPSLVRVLSGSHRVVVEARVVEPGQTGPDPDGDLLAVVDGEVRMDGTADVQRTLTLTVAEEQFPRRVGDRLLPDGTEVFVRRGVDTGAQILWVPLGYFVVYDCYQDNAPDGPIRIVGYDRMVRIIDEELLQGVRFDADTTYGQLFDTLVGGVYPAATISFDDNLGQQPLGRPLDVESSRMEALRTLAHGRGKILHWDGEGILRLRTAPDPSVPLWEANAGKDGVLSSAQRRITRRDVANVAVVRSQGGDTLAPARAVAIDDGPTSVTRFGGRFGRVPTRVDTPADITLEQAQQAARQTLLRRAGLPYQLTFTAVPNPALQPYDPVRVTLRDGTRERHVLQTLTVPLSAARLMTATTREQRLSRVVVVDA